MSGYYVISRNGYGEVTVKKSKFIANAFPIENESDAAAHIEAVRKQYRDARHNCYAFVAGEYDEVQRSSDDKEPSGTAGRPMLELIQSKNLHKCLVVVTRYFGGVLLGTGGLVRAYTAAAQAGIANAGVQERIKGSRICFSVDYASLARLQHIAGQMNLVLDDVQYTDKIHAEILADNQACNEFIEKLVESTAGKAVYSIEKDICIYRDV